MADNTKQRSPLEVRSAITEYLRKHAAHGRGDDTRVIAGRIGEPVPRVAAALGHMKRNGLAERIDTRGEYAYASDPVNWRLVGQLEHWEKHEIAKRVRDHG